MSEDTTTRAARAARNQSLYRMVNERVKEVNEGVNALLPVGEWVCECANDQCFATIEMTHGEYEAVRAGGARFFVKPDDAHVVREAETVTERNARFWIVEKIGVAGELAEHRNPRAIK